MDTMKKEERLMDVEPPYGTYDEYVNYLHNQMLYFRDKGYSNFNFKCDGGWDNCYYSLFGEREETEKECEQRLNKLKKQREQTKKIKEQKLVYERKEYERLKKKFAQE